MENFHIFEKMSNLDQIKLWLWSLWSKKWELIFIIYISRIPHIWICSKLPYFLILPLLGTSVLLIADWTMVNWYWMSTEIVRCRPILTEIDRDCPMLTEIVRCRPILNVDRYWQMSKLTFAGINFCEWCFSEILQVLTFAIACNSLILMPFLMIFDRYFDISHESYISQV